MQRIKRRGYNCLWYSVGARTWISGMYVQMVEVQQNVVNTGVGMIPLSFLPSNTLTSPNRHSHPSRQFVVQRRYTEVVRTAVKWSITSALYTSSTRPGSVSADSCVVVSQHKLTVQSDTSHAGRAATDGIQQMHWVMRRQRGRSRRLGRRVCCSWRKTWSLCGYLMGRGVN